MRASVIIPTYQGAHRIEGTLHALEQQTRKDFELIVVIDGSTDGTAQIVNQQKLTTGVRVVEQGNSGRAGARNAGAREANGSLLVFYDDDLLPESDSFEKHIAFHDQHTNAILTGNTPQYVKASDTDFSRYRAYLSTKWIKHYPDTLVLLQKGNLFMNAANCSLEKSLFDQLGGFAEKLTDAEDKEFGIRAFKQEIPLYFDRRIIAWHNESITCRSYTRRLRQYASANRAVWSMHPEFDARGGDGQGKKWMYDLLASSWWVDAVDETTFFSLVPQKIRYALYSAIIFALSEVHPEVPI